MRIKLLIVPLLLTLLACQTERTENEIPFDSAKWNIKEGKTYPFRDQMLHDIVYNYTIRSLNKSEILKLLGEPDRSTDGHLYYTIKQTRLGAWPMHTKSMVIKLSADTVAWIKIHE